MKENGKRTDTVIKLLFRMLPVQILLATIGAVNGIISSYFASNYIGVSAMSAVGVYGPVSVLHAAISALLAGGSAILCGKYLGRNEPEKVNSLFSVNLLLSCVIGLVSTILALAMGAFDLTALFTRDGEMRPLFNAYLIGQAIGLLPYLAGGQLPVYLAMENRQNLSMVASLVYIGINLLLKILFVVVLKMGVFGLALASSLGQWVFFGIQMSWFLGGRAHIRLKLRGISWSESAAIIRTGLPEAADDGYGTVCGFIVNRLLEAFVGIVGISAFTTVSYLLGFFWAVSNGMLTVSRLMISVSFGEEDRQTLVDVIRNMFRRFVPILLALAAVIALLAEPLTRLFFRDPTDPVYMMTVWGFRLMPLIMPLGVIYTHYACYCQTIGRQVLVHVLAALNGVVFMVGFSALLIPLWGIHGAYIANILNGVGCVLVIIGYAWCRLKRPPRNTEELLVLPEEFGVKEDERFDISIRNMDEVVTVSRQVGDFCSRRGIDSRRAYMASLCMEEMAGNIVSHGFRKDKKAHTIDIRVVHKGEDLILRIRDDCLPFNPEERSRIIDPEDRIKNLGIRMVYSVARRVEYQSILGLNVLTIKI